MTEEFVTSIVIDLSRRGFYITSNCGDQREVLCDSMDEFYQVMSLIDVCSEFDVDVSYAPPFVVDNAGVM